MQKKDKSQTFSALRKKHPFFIYENFVIERNSQHLILKFLFNLSDDYHFSPVIKIPVSANRNFDITQPAFQNLVFHLGMAELISYWKVACSPRVIIRAGVLDKKQVAWWTKLWFMGLGEFLYTNGIQTSKEELLKIEIETDRNYEVFDFEMSKKILVPIGGGKDSVVTLELLKAGGFDVLPFILNPRGASIGTVLSAGFERSEFFEMHRTISPRLIELNSKGYLNGHTPFSALLGFVTLVAAWISGIQHIALSNESSANEPTIPGTNINHQYSKSYEFEHDFRAYVTEFISPDFNYFSFLRPLNELQIGKLFSEFPNHFKSFKSCNVGSKTNVWCGKCPKCLFTWIILSPFLTQEKLISIFGANILDDKKLWHTLDELTGVAAEKPFECVGTVGEVRAALNMLLQNQEEKHIPALLEIYKNQNLLTNIPANQLLKQFDKNNYLKPDFEQIVKKALK